MEQKKEEISTEIESLKEQVRQLQARFRELEAGQGAVDHDALKASEARFRLLAETTSAAIFIYHDKELLYVNRTAAEVTGYTREELLKMNFWQILHPNWRKMAMDRGFARMRGEAVPKRYEVQIQTKDGQAKWVDFSAGFLEFYGKPSVLGTAFDISDRKAAQEALAESEWRYRRLTENARDMIWRTDANGVVSFVNNAVKHYLGYSVEEAIGLNLENYLAPSSIPQVREWVDKALNSNPPKNFFQGEVEYIHKDGHHFPCDLSVTLVLDKEGQIVTYEGISRNITKRKQAEKEKKRLEKQLYQTQKMESIGTLAGGIAHDFNNSLQIVLCSINLINEQLEASHDAFGNVQLIKKSAEQMAKWTNDLLAYARGTLSLKRNLDINESIRNAVELIQYNLTGRIDLHKDLTPNLPKILATPGEMEQIMVNLLINATEAIEGRGEIFIHSDLATEIPDPNIDDSAIDSQIIHVVVEDTGSGMNQATIERVYEPFFSTKFIGRGMGMAVVFGIVKSNGGKIYLHSKPGEGTRFDLYFPVVKRKESSDYFEKQEDSVEFSGEKILLVDDEEEMADLVSKALSDKGFLVVTAYNGKHAMELLDTHPDVGLVILDMVMPELDGLQAYVNIKQRLPNARFLVISGYDAFGPAKEVMEAGADDFLQKPFEMPALLDRVHKLQQK